MAIDLITGNTIEWSSKGLPFIRKRLSRYYLYIGFKPCHNHPRNPKYRRGCVDIL